MNLAFDLPTQSMLGELNRLNENLASYRERGLQTFVESLVLDDVGISKRMNSSSFRAPSTVAFSGGDNNLSASTARRITLYYLEHHS